MKFHRKSTALALAMVSTVLLVAGVVSASASSGSSRTSPKIGKARSSRDTSGYVYHMHLPPGKFFHVTYTSGLERIDSSSLVSHSGGAISRAVFAGDDFLLGTGIHTGRFSGELSQTLDVGSATTLHGVAHFPAAGTVTLTNTDTGTKITLRDGERFSIPTG